MIKFCLPDKDVLVAKSLGFTFATDAVPHCPLQVGDIIHPAPNSPVVYRVVLRTYFPAEGAASKGTWQVDLAASPHVVPPPADPPDQQTPNPAAP